MKIFSIIFLILLFISQNADRIYSQNLVPNGNFEQHRSFDYANGKSNNIGVLSDWKIQGSESAVYCHKYFVIKFGAQRFRELPYLGFDTLNVFDGQAMVKLNYGENCPFPYADRDTGCASYIKTKLISPLELGEVYEVSMWVYSKINPAADPEVYNHIGMYLTRHELFWKSETRIPTDYFFFSRIIPGQWTEIKWHIRALCSLEFLSIGVFRDNAFPSLFRGDMANEVSYFVDQVSIKKVNVDSLSANIYSTPYCEYYEKENKERILESITSLNVHFESKASVLDDKDKMELDSFYEANLLRKDKIFIIIGHTDNQTAENVSLSEARAESVKYYLIQTYHLPEMSILTFGLGSSYPIAKNESSSGRIQNRRVTIRTSDLDISQIFYRKGLDALKADNLEVAYGWFERWLRMVSFSHKIEIVVDPRLQKLKQSKYWNLLITSIKEGYSVYPEPMNAYFLDSLFVEDQSFRISNHWSFGGYIEEVDTVSTIEVKITEVAIRQIDDSNFAAAQKYFAYNGYPEISKVGRRPARGFGYVILHQSDSMTFVNTLSILKKLATEGEAEWDIYAKMADKLSILKNEPQAYGTQYQINSHGVHTLYKIDDINEVNRRRARIGMSPTEIPEN